MGLKKEYFPGSKLPGLIRLLYIGGIFLPPVTSPKKNPPGKSRGVKLTFLFLRVMDLRMSGKRVVQKYNPFSGKI